MKILYAFLFFFSSVIFACDESKFANLSKEDKFLAAAEQAEFVYFGKVTRLYRVPDTPKKVPGYNGIVFEVESLLKGKTLEYMDVEVAPTCGINTEYMENYWPTEIGDRYVVTGFKKDGWHYVSAVFPLEDALENIYRVIDEDDVPTIKRN